MERVPGRRRRRGPPLLPGPCGASQLSAVPAWDRHPRSNLPGLRWRWRILDGVKELAQARGHSGGRDCRARVFGTLADAASHIHLGDAGVRCKAGQVSENPMRAACTATFMFIFTVLTGQSVNGSEKIKTAQNKHIGRGLDIARVDGQISPAAKSKGLKRKGSSSKSKFGEWIADVERPTSTGSRGLKRKP